MSIRVVLVSLVIWIASTSIALAAPHPPYWDFGTESSPALHDPRAVWPEAPGNPQDCDQNCGDWQPYTRFGRTINDPRVQDPSNGGTSPQNYVNISSSCVDTAKPSIYFNIDNTNEILFFRWRVAQIAHTYATGPSAGSFSSSSPWNSALWTVFFDTTGDGYRNYAAHLDGSSGSPSTAIDRLVGIWANESGSQSIDYVGNPEIHEIGHNPTAFIDPDTQRILNFGISSTPTASWPHGSNETKWDYGTTRAQLISKSPGADDCTEYFVDYQIPFAFLDAAGAGGPTVGQDSALALLFCTANSLNNPLQKDCALEDSWVSNTQKSAPYGDFITLGGDVYQQPIVFSVSATGCGPTTLTATVNDALHVVDGAVVPSLDAVAFYYYADSNRNGSADDDNEWVYMATGAAQSLNRWTASWNTSLLTKGSYLIGIQALDQASLNASGVAHRTFSYLTQGEVDQLAAEQGVTAGEAWFGNPPVQGVSGMVTLENSCGQPLPYLSKSVSPTEVTAGEVVTFSVTLHNTLANSSVTLQTVTDMLPPGFIYESTVTGLDAETLTPTVEPDAGSTGQIAWSFSPPADVPANGVRTLVFRAEAPMVTGTYANIAQAESSAGTLTSDPVQIGVGAPRLTLAKSANVVSAEPGELITYTIQYANDSPVNVTSAVITDVLPEGLTFVSALDGGSYTAGTRTVTWPVSDLVSGDGPFSVRFEATVDDPYPDSASLLLVNTAGIDSPQTAPVEADASLYVNAPRPNLTLEKRADLIQVGPGNPVVFTLQYRNAGNAEATGVVITDTIPTGFTFDSASNGGALSGGTVAWSIGNVAAGASGSVVLTLQASTPFTGNNPTINTAAINSAQTDSHFATATVGINNTATVCSDYYFRRDTFATGALTGQYIANTTVPTSGTAMLATQSNVGSTDVEIARFYSDPVTSSSVGFSGPITTTLYVDKTGAPQATMRVELYSYNPTTEAVSFLGGTNSSNLTGNSTNTLVQVSVTPAGNVPAGHRLLWIVKGLTDHATQTNSLTLRFDGTPSLSRSRFCTASPANLVMDKQASTSSVLAGEVISYTIRFANAGGSNATNAVLSDTLPTGINFVSAFLNGGQVTPNIIGQQLSFTVNSSDTGTAGQVSGGQSGTLVINAMVDAPLSPNVAWLTNTASIQSDQTAPLSDAATTAVLHPSLAITKQADNSLLIPGDRVTYTVTILNSGTGMAANVTITDILPVEPFFSYVENSTRLNGNPVDNPDPVDAGTLSLNIGNLPPGEAAQVTFQMQVEVSGVPGGITVYDNVAQVDSTQTEAITSSPVTVAISTNPNLRFTKTAEIAAPLQPGDLITYTLVVSNTGSGAAQAVIVHDPIPANALYVPDSLVTEDSGHFDADNNRVVFAIAELPGSGVRTLQFTVRVDSLLPAGSTTLDNTASVSASNSPTRVATASVEAVAAPVLSVRKFGPETVAYPAATLAETATSTTIFVVDDVSQLATGQYVLIDGLHTAQILGIEGTTVEVDTQISAGIGATVVGEILYNITYGNEGNASATNVVLTDTLPGGSIFIMATDGGTYADGLVTWSLGSLDPDSSGAVQLRIFPGGPGTLINLVEIDSNETSPTSDTTVTAAGGLRTRKYTGTPFAAQTQSGTSTTYVIEVENTLPTEATGVTIADSLPSGFTYSSTVGFSGATRVAMTPQPVPGDEEPVWGTFSIPSESTLVLTFTVMVAPSAGPAVYENFVNVDADVSTVQFDALGTAIEDVTVQWADLHLSKTVTPATVIVGEPVTYTITVENAGDAPAVNVTITDVLPSDFSYLSMVLIQESKASRTAVMNPTAGDLQPAWGEWSIEPGGLVTITFSAHTGSVTGTFSNTVQVDTESTATPALENVAPVILTAIPEPPTAVDDAETGLPGEPVVVDVLANDKPGDGALDLTSVQIVGAPSPGRTLLVADEGTWSVNAGSGAITFTPEGGFSGNPSPIQYVVADVNEVQSNAATVTITYLVPPTAVDDAETGLPGEPVVVDVLANDKPGDGALDLTSVQIVGAPSPGRTLLVADEGTWSVNAGSGAITFTPESGFSGNPSPIQYVVADVNEVQSNAATVTITYLVPQTAMLSSFVWLDENEDGLMLQNQVRKPGVPDVTVHLFRAGSSEIVSTTVTDKDGHYLFADLEPAAYYLEFVVPDDYSFTTPHVGEDEMINSKATQPTLALEVEDVTTHKPVAVGADIQYMMTLYNLGNRRIEGIEILVTVPDFTVLALNENPDWSCSDNQGLAGSSCVYALNGLAPGVENAAHVSLALTVTNDVPAISSIDELAVTLHVGGTQRTPGRTETITLAAGMNEQRYNAGLIRGYRYVAPETPPVTPIVLAPTNLVPEQQPSQTPGFIFIPAVQR